MRRTFGPARLLSVALVAGALVAVAPAPPSGAADPAGRALARLQQDADRPLTVRTGSDGNTEFVGVPARAEVDNPAVTVSTSPGAASDAAIARYGAAVGTGQPGTTVERTAVDDTGVGDVVRYQQEIGGVPVLGGQVVVSLRHDGELSSILSDMSAETAVAAATVGEEAAETRARAAFAKSVGAGSGARVASLGRWVLDAGLIGGDASAEARTAWRFEISRGADERRQIMVDDRTGGIVMNVDEIHRVTDRVVCDNANVRRVDDVPCTSGFARTETSVASGVADVNSAFELSGVVADFYQQVGGIDLTGLLGVPSGGRKRLAATVRWCYTGADNACPYDNAFWNGSQMYYGQGFAAADDVVGHEVTHGFTERTSGLFYWGQSGAMNESISDIIGEIIDHRRGADSDVGWRIGEGSPGFPNGLRSMADPTIFGQPDKTSSIRYVREGVTAETFYPDSDGVHTNSGVGNKTAYLISHGGTFNGRTVTGIDTGDPDLTKSARLWLLVDQSLTSGSDYADEAAVLDQSCQALLDAGTAGFSTDDCASVHEATLATELRLTPVRNPQVADAQATCASGTLRVLLDSETGTPEEKFVAGDTWGRGTDVAHSGPSSWLSDEPETAGVSSLTTSLGISIPAGQSTYLFFRRWHVLEYLDSTYFDGMTVEVDDVATAAPPADAAALPWVNGPTATISSDHGNPAKGRKSFSGDSRGYVASRLDLSSFAGKRVRTSFTMNTDSNTSYVGLALDDITVYTCDLLPPVDSLAAPQISGSPRFGARLTADPGSWEPADVAFEYQWLRGATPIPGATAATYDPVVADVGSTLRVRVSASRTGYVTNEATSAATAVVRPATMVPATPSIAGTPALGRTLKAAPGVWAPTDAVLRYQWLRNGAPIRGADAAAYVATAADVGRVLAVRVTGSRAGYTTAIVTSRPTGAVAPGALVKRKPSVAGKPRVGTRLTAKPGAWKPAGVTLRFQWLRNGKPIKKATKPKYRLVGGDQGKRISVRVTGSKAGYATASATSKATGKVKAKTKKRR